MDTSALIVTFTAAGIQITLAWNFHKIYVRLFERFRETVDAIAEKRNKAFRDGLWNLSNYILNEYWTLRKEGTNDTKTRVALKDPKYVESIKWLYTSVANAEEPLEIYTRTREAVRSAYRYFMISAIVTLLGLIPAVTGDTSLSVLYFFWVVSLVFALIAWDEFYKSEKALIELRDKGE